MNARPAPPTVPPPRFRRGPVIAGIAVTTALVLGGWGLWRVLAGQAAGRQSASDVTVFDSVGFALEDYAALRYIHQRATAENLGIEVELVPTDGDPKDLFGRTRGDRQRVALRRVA